MQIFLLFSTKKTYFFYFTHPILQNTHINLSVLHIYSIKYSFFYNFLLFSPSLPLSHRPNNTNDLSHTQPPSSPTQPASSRKINPLNPRNKHSETHSIWNPVNRRHRRSSLITSSIQNWHNRLHHQLWSHHTHRRTPTLLFVIPYGAPILEKKKGQSRR